jgi:hypothetical protein
MGIAVQKAHEVRLAVPRQVVIRDLETDRVGLVVVLVDRYDLICLTETSASKAVNDSKPHIPLDPVLQELIDPQHWHVNLLKVAILR